MHTQAGMQKVEFKFIQLNFLFTIGWLPWIPEKNQNVSKKSSAHTHTHTIMRLSVDDDDDGMKIRMQVGSIVSTTNSSIFILKIFY